jgi:beta-glucanase (GH16 family)
MTPSMRFQMSAVVLCGALASCGGGGAGVIGDDNSATASSALPAGYQLVWEDNFTAGVALDSTYWTYDTGSPLFGGSVWGNDEKQYYTSNPNNVYLSNGQLVIQPVYGNVPANSGAPSGVVATSARVKTDTANFYTALGNQPYGFYEINAQIPCVAGAWPAIWMMGKDGDWPARGELDIMEWFGRYFVAQPDQVQSGVHTTDNNGSGSLYDKQALPGLCQGMHRYQLHWTSTQLVFGVDDSPTFTYNKPAVATPQNWPFDQPAHLLLNVAVGGNLGGSFVSTDVADMTMRVDYVKVWQPQ